MSPTTWAPSSTSISAKACPTRQISSILKFSFLITPSWVEGISAVALSVSTSQIFSNYPNYKNSRYLLLWFFIQFRHAISLSLPLLCPLQCLPTWFSQSFQSCASSTIIINVIIINSKEEKINIYEVVLDGLSQKIIAQL